MTSGGTYPPGATTAETAGIAVAEPARLRDYFLRLGAKAELIENCVLVELTDAQEHEASIEDYLRAWVDVNRLPATLEPVRTAPAPPADAFASERPRLGDLLTTRGLITQSQLADGLAESRATNDLLGRVLIRRGYIFEDELARSLAAQLSIPYVNLRIAGVERGVARMMPASEGIRVGAIPIGYHGGRLRVAFADPSDSAARATVEQYVGAFEVTVAELSDIDLAWRSVERLTSYGGIA